MKEALYGFITLTESSGNAISRNQGTMIEMKSSGMKIRPDGDAKEIWDMTSWAE
jgi:hypothetical protein